MAFTYKSGTLEELKSLYQSMRILGVSIGTFSHEYNKIESAVIFDTRDSNGWKLVFMKLIQGDVFEVPVKLGYKFTIDGDETYRRFREYFKIGGGKGVFSMSDFVNHLRQCIPVEYKLNDEKRHAVLRYDKLDNESEGIYPIGVTNWEVVHAKNPKLNSDKFHRTNKNLIKTKELYPHIYVATRDMDITIIYGLTPGKKTEGIKAGDFEELSIIKKEQI